MEAAEDAELVRRTRGGELRAFEGLVARYERPVFHLALRMLGNHEDARDVTQTAFVKAYQHLDQFDGRSRFFSWIYRIAVNESLNARARRRPEAVLDDSLPWTGRSPEEEAGQSELQDILQDVLMRLEPAQRALIVMRHQLQLSYAEIAETLRIPEKTVKSRLFTARRAMESLLRRRGVHQA